MEEADIHAGRINDQLGTQLEGLSAQFEARVEQGRNAMSEWKARCKDQFSLARQHAEESVKERPWQWALGAMGAGLLLGCLLGRR